MTVLWINLALVYILGVGSRYFSTQYKEFNGFYIPKSNLFLFFISTLLLIMISGLRSNIGDTYFYMYSYSRNSFELSELDLKGDFGFNIIQAILKRISEDPQILIFFCALITNLLICLTLYKFSFQIEIALYVYITSGLYLTSMNGIRQFLAASIAFAGTHYLFKRNFTKYLFIILLASTIHKSALILIFAYFFVNSKAWKPRTIVLLGLGIILIIGYNSFSTILFKSLESTQYGHYKDFSEGGASIFRVLVNSVPILVAFFGRKRLERIAPNSDIIVNMSLLGVFFMLISTQNWIFARLAIYFQLYNVLLVSWITVLFLNKDRKLLYFVLLLCYVAYYFYESVLSLGIEYKSEFFY